MGLNRSWEELAGDLGVPVSELRDLKKAANVDTGVRHAAKTGVKMRANAGNYGSWVCALFDAINAARVKLDSEFKPMTAAQVSEAVARAVPTVPYD